MLLDSWTIIAKEWREWCCIRARFGWGVLILLIVAWSFAAPALLGDFTAGPLLIPVVWAALPITLAAAMITDSIAGERERQTLETLLASRLPDRAILLGKLAAITLLGWLLLALGALPGLLHQLLAPASAVVSPSIMGGMLLGFIAPGILTVVLVGALLSLYTPNVRFALLLTIAFAGFLMLGATALAIGWAEQSIVVVDAVATPLIVISAGTILIDTVLLSWLLLAVHRDRLLAIG